MIRINVRSAIELACILPQKDATDSSITNNMCDKLHNKWLTIGYRMKKCKKVVYTKEWLETTFATRYVPNELAYTTYICNKLQSRWVPIRDDTKQEK